MTILAPAWAEGTTTPTRAIMVTERPRPRAAKARITTVSPGYAREICTPEQGMGLDAVLRARPDGVTGYALNSNNGTLEVQSGTLAIESIPNGAGMTGFGASGPAELLYKHFGITADAVVAAARSRL